MNLHDVSILILRLLPVCVCMVSCQFVSDDDLVDIYARGSSQITFLLHRFGKDADPADRNWAEAAGVKWCFGYWAGAYGPRAFHRSLPFYERHLANNIWRHVRQHELARDPLGIRAAYTDGVLRKNTLFLIPAGVRRGDLRRLKDYEDMVSRFRQFFESKASEGLRLPPMTKIIEVIPTESTNVIIDLRSRQEKAEPPRPAEPSSASAPEGR